MNKIAEKTLKSKKILICMHVDPDGDTIGSACGLASALKKLKKDVELYSSSKIPDIYKFLNYAEKVKHKIEKTKKYDALVALDCADSKRIPDFEQLKKQCKIIINVDHHIDNSLFGDINFVKNISSTGEIVYELIKMLKVEINKDIATALFSAIITDTGNFRYSNTSAKVFKIASDLVEKGANPHFISTNIYESKTMAEINILATALNKIKIVFNGKVAYSALTKKEIDKAKAIEENMSSIADFVRTLKGVEIAAFLRETNDGKIKINLRSKNRNVRIIAKELGGGGHTKSAGVIINCSLNKAINTLLKTIKNKWKQL